MRFKQCHTCYSLKVGLGVPLCALFRHSETVDAHNLKGGLLDTFDETNHQPQSFPPSHHLISPTELDVSFIPVQQYILWKSWRGSSAGLLTMAQIRGTAGYNLGGQNTFGAPSNQDSTDNPSPLDTIRAQTSKIEDFLDTFSDPIKPYVPHPQHYANPAMELPRRLILEAFGCFYSYAFVFAQSNRSADISQQLAVS